MPVLEGARKLSSLGLTSPRNVSTLDPCFLCCTLHPLQPFDARVTRMVLTVALATAAQGLGLPLKVWLGQLGAPATRLFLFVVSITTI